jgi:hypothetical protein
MQGRHTKPTITPAATTPRHASGAVTWIDRDRAVVARRSVEGTIDVSTIRRETCGAPFLARVAHAIGDPDRVVITGAGALRTALEREYVAIYQRPERLLDEDATAGATEAALLERLRELSD